MQTWYKQTTFEGREFKQFNTYAKVTVSVECPEIYFTKKTHTELNSIIGKKCSLSTAVLSVQIGTGAWSKFWTANQKAARKLQARIAFRTHQY